jgi:hypothetical protein
VAENDQVVHGIPLLVQALRGIGPDCLPGIPEKGTPDYGAPYDKGENLESDICPARGTQAKNCCRSSLSQKRQDLIGTWDAPGLLFGIYQCVAKQNFEVAFAPTHKGYGGSCLRAQSFRKTCGACFIAHSQTAVDDLYLHCVAPMRHGGHF